MLLSRKWLNEFVPVEAKDRAFAEDMTLSGSKVEVTEVEGEEISNVVVGRVVEIKRHENSDTCGFVRWMWEKALPFKLSQGHRTFPRGTWSRWPKITAPCPGESI